jgi:XTP/dITP diphosphohydrolase
MSVRLLIATRSPGKQRDIRGLFKDVPQDIVFPDDAGIYERPEEAALENEPSFEGNARRKAEYFARLSAGPTAADDSGIEVLTLGGAPGVRSKRFAMPAPDQDAANNAELLRRLAGAPQQRRRARYKCVVVLVKKPGAIPEVFEGTCGGTILEEPRGTGGFGYDPLFLSDDLGKTFGEATDEEKNAISHRGKAFRALTEWLAAHQL